MFYHFEIKYILNELCLLNRMKVLILQYRVTGDVGFNSSIVVVVVYY